MDHPNPIDENLQKIYHHKDVLLNELQRMSTQIGLLLSQEDVDELNTERILELIKNRGQVLWTLDKLEQEAEPLRREAGEDFQAFYRAHLDKLALIYEQVMAADRTQQPKIQKHMNVLRKQLQDARNAQKTEQAYQSSNPYEQQDQGSPRFLDTFK